MNRHVLYLVLLLGLTVACGVVAMIRPLHAAQSAQRSEIIITPRMAQTLQR